MVVFWTLYILSLYILPTFINKNDIKEREIGGFTSQRGSVGRNVGKCRDDGRFLHSLHFLGDFREILGVKRKTQ
jgi:hypothetical protein